MESTWRPQSRTPLFAHVDQRVNFTLQDFKISSQNETYMRDKIKQIRELHCAVESAEQEIGYHIDTWDPKVLLLPTQRIRPGSDNYSVWIADIKSDGTISDIGNHKSAKLMTWLIKYSKLQTKIDKLRLRISIKIESVNKTYNVQTQFVQPVFESFEVGEINKDTLSGGLTSIQFKEGLKLEIHQLSTDHINAAIISSMSSDDIVKLFLSKKLLLFISNVKTCIEQAEPFGNIASDISINNTRLISQCIEQVKTKMAIDKTTSSASMAANRTLNMDPFDKLLEEFTTLIGKITTYENKFVQPIMFPERIRDLVAHEDIKEFNQTMELKRKLRVREYAKIAAIAPGGGGAPSRPRLDFTKFKPPSKKLDYDDSKDDIILTSMIESTAELYESAKNSLSSNATLAQSAFSYASNFLGSLCANVRTQCPAVIGTVSENVSQILRSLTPIVGNVYNLGFGSSSNLGGGGARVETVRSGIGYGFGAGLEAIRAYLPWGGGGGGGIPTAGAGVNRSIGDGGPGSSMNNDDSDGDDDNGDGDGTNSSRFRGIPSAINAGSGSSMVSGFGASGRRNLKQANVENIIHFPYPGEKLIRDNMTWTSVTVPDWTPVKTTIQHIIHNKSNIGRHRPVAEQIIAEYYGKDKDLDKSINELKKIFIIDFIDSDEQLLKNKKDKLKTRIQSQSQRTQAEIDRINQFVDAFFENIENEIASAKEARRIRLILQLDREMGIDTSSAFDDEMRRGGKPRKTKKHRNQKKSRKLMSRRQKYSRRK